MQSTFVPSARRRTISIRNRTIRIPFEGNVIDLGETAAEQLGLALDPYPRISGVEMPTIEDKPK